MHPAPVYAPLKGSAQPLESLRDVPLRDLEDVEASMLRVTASSLIEQALTWGSARAQFHGYHLEARREAGEVQTLVSLSIRRGADIVVKEQLVMSQAARDAARRQRH
jgi:hypothetical protein